MILITVYDFFPEKKEGGRYVKFESYEAEVITHEATKRELKELQGTIQKFSDLLVSKLSDSNDAIDNLARKPETAEAYRISKSRRNLYEEIIELFESLFNTSKPERARLHKKLIEKLNKHEETEIE